MAYILIIDDQPFTRITIGQELMDEGHQVLYIKDTENLLDNLRDHEPDIVLLDLLLNGLEGFNILRDIKNEKPGLPVVIISAYTTFMNDPRVAQADGYIIKDISSDHLKNKINQLLSGLNG
jgi:DNA-binding response OmpR family regulator